MLIFNLKTIYLFFKMRNWSLYFYSIIYLKPIQIFSRIKFLVYRPIFVSSPRVTLRQNPSIFREPIDKPESLIDGDRFIFLNHEGSIREIGWNGPQRSKLWRYNQHYFDFLNCNRNSLNRDQKKNLISCWINDNPPFFGVGWDAYPTSLRIVNWIKFYARSGCVSNEFSRSLALQGNWLERRLETHILGNHLFSNAKALIFLGAVFRGIPSDRWLRTGLRLAERELEVQILSDGGHFELSPMYHSLFLEDLLDLINLDLTFRDRLPRSFISKINSLIPRLLSWLSNMTHPDGQLSFFNDATLGVAPTLGELVSYSARLGMTVNIDSTSKLIHLKSSGYISIKRGAVRAIIDVAHIGPDYLPGHAHADTLSFELSVGSQRILVNGGTSEYEVGHIRSVERSTRNHNTVGIGVIDSSEMWASFRVARRAKPSRLQIHSSGSNGIVKISCTHDGYRRLDKNLFVSRQWEFKDDQLLVVDELTDSSYSELAVAYYHFHPHVTIAQLGPFDFSLSLGSRKIMDVRVLMGLPKLLAGQYSPGFGVVQPNCRLCISLLNGCSQVLFEWGS